MTPAERESIALHTRYLFTVLTLGAWGYCYARGWYPWSALAGIVGADLAYEAVRP